MLDDSIIFKMASDYEPNLPIEIGINTNPNFNSTQNHLESHLNSLLDNSKQNQLGLKKCFKRTPLIMNTKLSYAHKRRKLQTAIPPTKFLLGGSITDPLNLSSLENEEINRSLNEPTPEGSPSSIQVPNKEQVQLRIPSNINDPLNLSNNDPVILNISHSCRRKSRSKKRSVCETISDQEEQFIATGSNEFSLPQESSHLRLQCKRKYRQNNAHKKYNHSDQSGLKQGGRFIYGNYDRYYGKRDPEHNGDLRLNLLKSSWFEGNEILDIGCNVGHITLCVARNFHPRRILGIDIDPHLISIARKNVRHYLHSRTQNEYPSSFLHQYGSLTALPIPKNHTDLKSFPHNIQFVCGNYVPENENEIDMIHPEFDVILALSITKWIHLNWGDRGIILSFKKIFAQLKPEGRLLLEFQSWESYRRRRKLTADIWKTYQKLQLRPSQFPNILLNQIGFSRYELIGTPNYSSPGFQRSVYMFIKGEETSSQVNEIPHEQNDSTNLDTEANINQPL